METTTLYEGIYWGCMGTMENKIETIGNYYSILRLFRDNSRYNGNYYSILGLYEDSGKENGNYYIILGYVRGCMGIMEKKMETTILLGSFQNGGGGLRGSTQGYGRDVKGYIG